MKNPGHYIPSVLDSLKIDKQKVQIPSACVLAFEIFNEQSSVSNILKETILLFNNDKDKVEKFMKRITNWLDFLMLFMGHKEQLNSLILNVQNKSKDLIQLRINEICKKNADNIKEISHLTNNELFTRLFSTNINSLNELQKVFTKEEIEEMSKILLDKAMLPDEIEKDKLKILLDKIALYHCLRIIILIRDDFENRVKESTKQHG